MQSILTNIWVCNLLKRRQSKALESGHRETSDKLTQFTNIKHFLSSPNPSIFEERHIKIGISIKPIPSLSFPSFISLSLLSSPTILLLLLLHTPLCIHATGKFFFFLGFVVCYIFLYNGIMIPLLFYEKNNNEIAILLCVLARATTKLWFYWVFRQNIHVCKTHNEIMIPLYNLSKHTSESCFCCAC